MEQTKYEIVYDEVHDRWGVMEVYEDDTCCMHNIVSWHNDYLRARRDYLRRKKQL